MNSSFLTQILLPLSLFIIMMGMGLSLQLKDFKRVVVFPKAVLLGTIGQLIVLPLLGFVVAYFMASSALIAVGIMLIAACPGGTSSNLITHLAKGDTALSITLTAISSLVTVITIPLIVAFSMDYFLADAQQFELPVLKTIVTLIMITLLPVSLGMLIRHFAADFAIRQEPRVNVFSGLFLVFLVVAIVVQQWQEVKAGFATTGLSTLTLNVSSMILGYVVAKLFLLNDRQSTSITIEIGVQNGTMAILIATTLLNSPTLAIPAAIYSLAMFTTSIVLIISQRYKSSNVVTEPIDIESS